MMGVTALTLTPVITLLKNPDHNLSYLWWQSTPQFDLVRTVNTQTF